MRRCLKRNVLPRLPLSGVWRFFYMYVVRLGFLDGVAGLRFCLLLATYDLLISLKLAEIRTLRIDEDAKRLAEEPSKGLAVPEGEVANTPEVVAGPGATLEPATKPVVATPMATAAVPPSMGTPTVEAKPPSSMGVPLPPPGEPPAPEPVRPEVGDLVEQLRPHVNIPGRWPAYRSVPVSILVPVKNEERNIVECLRRCNWATEVVVVDSRSTDGTIALSQAMGADVYQFNYDRKTGWPKKKNWALECIPWKNEWVMILDADEYMTEELAEEIRQVVTGEWKPTHGARAGCGDGFWVNRRFMFLGRWLKGCGYYPRGTCVCSSTSWVATSASATLATRAAATTRCTSTSSCRRATPGTSRTSSCTTRIPTFRRGSRSTTGTRRGRPTRPRPATWAR